MRACFAIYSCQMNSELGSFQLPISAMNMFNNLSILLLVPFCDIVLYPYLKKNNYDLSMFGQCNIIYRQCESMFIVSNSIYVFQAP